MAACSSPGRARVTVQVRDARPRTDALALAPVFAAFTVVCDGQRQRDVVGRLDGPATPQLTLRGDVRDAYAILTRAQPS